MKELIEPNKLFIHSQKDGFRRVTFDREHCLLNEFTKPSIVTPIHSCIHVPMRSHKSTDTMKSSVEPLADPVNIAAARMGICRAKLYQELAEGKIKARKAGRRTLIERVEQERWLKSLPVMGAPE